MSELLSAEDLLAKMRAGTKEIYEVQFRQLTIPMRILSLDELLTIRNTARVEKAKVNGDDAYMAAVTQKETIRAACSLNQGTPGIISDRMLALMRLDEVEYIYKEYGRITDEVNPALEQVKPEQFQLLVQAIKKNSVTARDLSLPQLKAVFLSFQNLIQELDSQTLPQDNSLGGPF